MLKAVINSERPWLLVDIEPIEEPSESSDSPDMWVVRASNTGRTPAELRPDDTVYCSCKMQAAAGFIPPDDTRDPFNAPLRNLIVNGDGFEIRRFMPTDFSQGELEGMTPRILHVYGRLLYWDTFRDRNDPKVEPFITQWDFTYNSDKGGFFRTAGPYTKNT